MTPEEFRAAGHQLIDWIADYRARLDDLPVGATTKPGQVAAQFPATPPETPLPDAVAHLIATLDDVVLPGITTTQSPNFFGWFPSNAELSSVLGDLASSGVGALGITWESAPALTEVEQVVTAWLRDSMALPSHWQGAIHDTASTAALVALLAARERASGHRIQRQGLSAQTQPLTVYTSAQAHSSVLKAAVLAGFGHEYVRSIEVDPVTFALNPAALRAALEKDTRAGCVPAAIVATLGTTGTTAFDPLPEIGALAREHGAWLHVDAAMAGAALLLPEQRHWAVGLEAADSFCWNPHKWFGTVLDTSLLYVADPADLTSVMSTDPSYLRSAADGEVVQYRDWGIPLGRRFRALKLWWQLSLDGLESVRERLRRDLANATWLAEQAAAEPDWRVIAPVALQTVCLRHEPAGVADLDAHTRAWSAAVNASGQAFVTPAIVNGEWVVRVSVGSLLTERAHVEKLWQQLRQVVQAY